MSITVALAAIGPGTMRRAGYRPLALGTLTWATVACTGLLLQFAVGTW